MATTGFWPVKGDLLGVIKYAQNPDKTIDKRYVDDELFRTLQYAEDGQKTDKTMYVSAINCPKQLAYERMTATKRRFGKTGGNIAYHGFQSFRPGEVTPEQAHSVGMETAREMWGDNYEVVVTTHLNTDSIHNHFVVNSVSFKTGRKFENHVSDHIRLREISDRICREHGISVLENAPFYGGDKGEYWRHRNDKLTHRDMLRRDVDIAMSFAADYTELTAALRYMGYEIMRGDDYAHISVKAEDWKRPVRLDNLGKAYSAKNLEQRFIENKNGIVTVPKFLTRQHILHPLIPDEIIHLEVLLITKNRGREDLVEIYFDLFIALLKLVKSIAETVWQPLSPDLRQEARNIEQYVAEQRFVKEHGLVSPTEVNEFIVRTEADIVVLENERSRLDNRIRRAKTPEDKERLKAQRREFSSEISMLRQTLKTAQSVYGDIPKIEKLLKKEIEMEQDMRQGRNSRTKTDRKGRQINGK